MPKIDDNGGGTKRRIEGIDPATPSEPLGEGRTDEPRGTGAKDAYVKPEKKKAAGLISGSGKRGSERMFGKAGARARPASKKTKDDPAIELLRIEAKSIAGPSDSLGAREREAFAILLEARNYIRKTAKPNTKVIGWRPSEKLIKRSLRTGFRKHYRRHPTSGETFYLEGPFRDLIEDSAEELGLAGTKERTKGKGRPAAPKLPSQHKAAAKVLHALDLAREIEDFSIAMLSMATDEHVAKSQGRIEELLAEAEEIEASLTRQGRDGAAITSAMQPKARRSEAMKDCQRIEEIRDEMLFLLIDANLNIEDERIDALMSMIVEDARDWANDNQEKYGVDMEGLEAALRTYLAFWLGMHPGETLLRIGFSQEALRNARKHIARSAPDGERGARLSEAIARLVSHLTWLTPNHVGKIRTSSSWSAREFESAIGNTLYDALNGFRGGIRGGEIDRSIPEENRKEAAESFYGLFLKYVHYASITNPDRTIKDVLIEDGLDPRITRAMYSNPGLASEYGGKPLELLRRFFEQHVTSKPVPEIAELVPLEEIASQEAVQRPAEEMEFVPPADNMRGYLRNMPFPITSDLARRYKEATGYSLYNSMSWGSVRPFDGRMTEDAWSALIDMAESEAELRDMLRSYRPDETAESEWKETIASLTSMDELAEFAVNHRPSKITKGDWKRYVDYCIESGHPEYVTKEPSTNAALGAVIPGFAFFRREAASYGMIVDALDYLAAIYPAARRIRDRAHDGTITIRVPSFMSDLPFRNWGLETWADQIIKSKLVTDVSRGTQLRHSRGSVKTEAELRTMRRYIEPLAEGDPEKERTLDEFLQLLRFVRLIDHAAHAYDSTGAKVTYAPATVPSRFILKFEDDLSTYPVSDEILMPGIEDTLFIDIGRGHYANLLDLAQEHLDNLALLPKSTTITRKGGAETTIEELRHELNIFRSDETYYRQNLSDGSGMASQRSGDDRAEIREFYSNLRKMVRDVLFDTRVHGTIYTGHGPVQFQASIRLDGHRQDFKRSAKPVLFIDDLSAIAKQEGWDSERVSDLITMRILVDRSIAYGDLPKTSSHSPLLIEEAVKDMWMGNATSLERAAKDYAELEASPVKDRLDGRNGAIRILRKSAGSRRLREPILPGGRLTPSWQNQWRQYAVESALDGTMTEIALEAMTAYFLRTPDLHMFSEEILSEAISEQVVQQDYVLPERSRLETIDEIARWIATFLPTIGVAGGTQRAALTGNRAQIEHEIARRAVAEYRGLFPQKKLERNRIPILKDRLMQIIHVHCLEHEEEHSPRPFMVFSTARALLEDYNRSVRQPSPLTLEWTSSLKDEGLLIDRIEAFGEQWDGPAGENKIDLVRVRHAYFRLYDAFMRGQNIKLSQAEQALAESSTGGEPNEIEARFLIEFFKHQRATLMAWRAAVSHPSMGFSAYVRKNYTFENGGRIEAAVFEAFANSYAEARMTSVKGVDSLRLSLDVAEGALGSADTDGRVQMAGFLRSLFESWLDDTAGELDEELQLADIAIEEAVKDSTDIERTTVEAILSQAAKSAGLKDIQAMLAAEEKLSLIGELTGGKRRDKRLRPTVERLLAKERGLRREEAERIRLAAIANAEGVLATAVGRSAALAWRATELYGRWRELPPVEGMTESDIDAMTSMSDEASGTIDELEEGLKAVKKTTTPALGTMEKSGVEVDQDLDPCALIESAFEYTSRTTDVVLNAMEEGAKRLKGIKEAERIQEEKDISLALKKKAVRALNNTERLIEAVDSAIRDLKSIEDELARQVDRAGALINETIPGISGNAKEFEAVAADLGSISESMNAIMDSADDIEGKLRNIVSGKHASLPSAEAALEALDSAAAEGLEDEIAQTQGELISQVQVARETAASMESTRERAKAALREMEDRLNSAEADLPTAPAAGIPETKAIDRLATDAAGYHFQEIRLKDDPLKKQGSYVREIITHGRVLSIPGKRRGERKSWLIAKKDAGAVDVWRKGSRDKELIVHDVFGNAIRLHHNEHGVALEAISSLPEGHEFAIMFETLGNAIAEHTNEVRLIATLSKPSLRGLFGDLLATMAAHRCATGDEARKLVRAWALSRRPELTKKLHNMHVSKFFVHESEPPPFDPEAFNKLSLEVEAVATRRLDEMSTEQFLRHAEKRIGSLGLLPADPAEIENRMMRFANQEEAKRNTRQLALTVNTEQPLQLLFVKIMLVLEEIDFRTRPEGSEEMPLSDTFRKAFWRWSETTAREFPFYGKNKVLTESQIARFAYKFLFFDFPAHIEAARRGMRIKDKKGNGGGNGGAAPVDSGQSGCTPPPSGGHGVESAPLTRSRSRSRETGATPVRQRGIAAGVRSPLAMRSRTALGMPGHGARMGMGLSTALGRAPGMRLPTISSGMLVH